MTLRRWNIRPSHGALNYEAALQASQHSDKIGNQHLLEYSSETFEGGGEETVSRWSGSIRLLTCSCGLSSTPQRF